GLLRGQAGKHAPRSVDELVGAIRETAPREDRNRVNKSSQFTCGLHGFVESVLQFSSRLALLFMYRPGEFGFTALRVDRGIGHSINAFLGIRLAFDRDRSRPMSRSATRNE